MDYYFKAPALADLKRLPKIIQKRIVRKLDYFTRATNPLRFSDVLKDRAIGSYRYRIGDYRVIFDVVDNKVIILTIGHRREIYR